MSRRRPAANAPNTRAWTKPLPTTAPAPKLSVWTAPLPETRPPAPAMTLRDSLLRRIAAMTKAPGADPGGLEAALADVLAGRLDAARARLDALTRALPN